MDKRKMKKLLIQTVFHCIMEGNMPDIPFHREILWL